MILQNITFPDKDICTETDLYYRVLHGTAALQDNHLLMETGARINFFTYFNSFSVAKWQKYTNVKEISLSLICQGKGIISLWQAVMRGEHLIKQELGAYPVETSGAEKVSLCFGDTEVQENTVYYIEIEALGRLAVHSGSYRTGRAKTVNPVNIAVGICTYRREKFVQKTLRTLNEFFLQNKDSLLYNHMQVFVSDNGGTLPLSESIPRRRQQGIEPKPQLNTEKIHIVHNRNVGGSGGFGRCILEAVRSMKQYHFTHILLMDDDIRLEPEVLFRTYTFLSVVKPSYQEHIIAGALLRMDVPYIQHANGELWRKGKLGLTKAGYDLRREYMLVKNEEELPIEYGGWWYCCIPLHNAADAIFPLPLFIHRDDIEHGLRYHGKLITLNGIGVWHDAFDNRRSSSLEYYDIRNALICNAIHYPEIYKTAAVIFVCKHLLGQMLRYRYEDQLLTIKAVEDFCKGVSFLKTEDTVLLNQAVSQMGYAPYDVTEALKENNIDKYYQPARPEELYLQKSFSLLQKLTLNGWLLPAKKGCKPVPFGAHPSELYRCRKVLLFEPDTGKGFIVKRQHRQLLISLGRCFQLWRLLNRHYDKAVQDYQTHAAELTTKEFWEKYLDI